ncbi:unnamed protein product [Tilletia laevis]|nr:unnamed protein product [Tilletia laevis]
MIQLLRDFHEDAGFIPEQWQLEVICCLAAGWDVVLSAGTGRGKSLIWEIAALLHPDKIFLVIVPLQAIEIDQVSKYTKTSISAIALSQSVITGKLQDQTDSVAQASTTNSVSSARNDHTARAARKKLQRDLRDGVYQLIFASPEMLLQNPNISLLLSEPSFKNRVGGVFVDEAHVVEDWGYRVSPGDKRAFRPEYAKIRTVRARIGMDVPCAAVSATLPHATLESVIQSLDLGRRNLLAIDAGTDRSNITYEVHPIRNSITQMTDLLRLFQPSYARPSDIPKTIIYVRTRMEAYRASALLYDFLGRPPGVVRPFTSLSSDAYKKSVMQEGFRTGSNQNQDQNPNQRLPPISTQRHPELVRVGIQS